MPYASGEIPELGDHVKHMKNGRTGTITHVQLNTASLGGRDQVSIKWDDGGIGIAVSVADEYQFLNRGTL
jgi:hypothetical protein